MSSVFREGHNKPKPRRRQPLHSDTPPNRYRKIAIWAPVAAVLIIAGVFWILE
jgi:hypothetical protein